MSADFLPLDQFLKEDWQQRARFFTKAIDVAPLQIPVETLITLVENELVESRLATSAGVVVHGPFEMDDSDARLLPDDTMLMIQCLEQHLASMDRLIRDSFGFIARWQIDDVMATFGYTGTSCGAHFDRYDVFLLQLQGEKHWALDGGQHTEADLQDDVDARLLREFTPTQHITAKPGDLLYIPPGVGHHGVCEGESLTLSIGIRNPTMADVLADLATEILSDDNIAAPLEQQLHRGSQLPISTADTLSSAINEVLNNDTLIRWYGSYVTSLRVPELLEPVDDIIWGEILAVALPSRLAVFDAEPLLWFVNGEAYELDGQSRDLVEQLTLDRQVQLPEHISEHFKSVLEDLLFNGSLFFER